MKVVALSAAAAAALAEGERHVRDSRVKGSISAPLLEIEDTEMGLSTRDVRGVPPFTELGFAERGGGIPPVLRRNESLDMNPGDDVANRIVFVN